MATTNLRNAITHRLWATTLHLYWIKKKKLGKKKREKSSHHPLCVFLSVCLSVCRSVSLYGYMYDVIHFVLIAEYLYVCAGDVCGYIYACVGPCRGLYPHASASLFCRHIDKWSGVKLRNKFQFFVSSQWTDLHQDEMTQQRKKGLSSKLRRPRKDGGKALPLPATKQ